MFNKGEASDDGSTSNTSHSDERDKSDFSPTFELKVPNEEARDDGKSEVRDDTKDAVDVAKRGDDGIVNTSALLALVPHVGDGVALK